MLREIKRIARLDKNCKRHMIIGTLFSFLFKVTEAAPDILFGLMIDLAIHKDRSFLSKKFLPPELISIYEIGVLILLVWGSQNLFQFLGSLHWKKAAGHLQFKMRMLLCESILAHNLFKQPTSGTDTETLRGDHRSTNQEIETAEGFVNKSLDELVRLVFSTVLIGPILFYIAPTFLLYALIPIVPTYFLSVFLQRRVRPRYNAVKRATRSMYREVDELIDGISVVRDFGLESRFFKRLEAAATRLLQESHTTAYLNSAMIPLTRILVHLGTLAILIHAVILVFQGQLSFGSFAATSFLSRKFLFPFAFLGGVVDSCLKGAHSIQDFFKVIDESNPMRGERLQSTPITAETISLRSLTYGYSDLPLFGNLNAEFQPGKLNVIKGPTGSGKTTIFRLLMQDLLPVSGQVMHGKLNLHELERSTWRDAIAILPQYPILFTASVLENITLFAPNPDAARLSFALKVSLSEEILDLLPMGINSVIGPSGIKLSGGQMQSIAIARALYSNASILLFDEPTSAFDLKRENAFLTQLKANIGDRMIIITSHRQQPIQAGDYVFDLSQA